MSILDEIIQQKRIEIVRLKDNTLDIEELSRFANAPRSFVKTFLNSPTPRIIAEVKKASPSKGLIRSDFEPNKIAQLYESTGATAISVLTDEKFFQGKLSYLTEIKKMVDLPLLRKDFIIDELQIVEAKGAGADAVLLIAAVLSEERLNSLLAKSLELKLDVLLEVHSSEELKSSLKVLENCKFENLSEHILLGINNRDLNTFETDISTTVDLLRIFEDQIRSLGISVISESGIFGQKDIELLEVSGAAGFLIGEALMRDESLLGQLTQSK